MLVVINKDSLMRDGLCGKLHSGRCKNGTDLLYHHVKHGGDGGSRAGCRRKSVLFFVTGRPTHSAAMPVLF